jgi:uncharacterized protein (TIGR02246 family)
MSAADAGGKFAMSGPEAVVQQQVEAYNARDAERFADCYADDARVLGPAGGVMMDGKAAIKQFYAKLFEQSPELQAQIAARMVVGEFVIDEEQGSGLVFEGIPPQLHAAVVYRVVDGKIVQAQLFM